ncbi:hypothetical protein FA15DRAFT_552878, partial [Coprinopsis marcescibilis]
EKRKAVDGKMVNQRDVSKDAGKVWKLMSVEEQQPFVDQAKKAKDFHALTYPGYFYNP